MTLIDTSLLSVHLGATAAMMGLIWFVQVVHYPLFDLVGVDGFRSYAEAHRRQTSFVVGPLMAVELLTAVWLVVQPPVTLGRALPLLGLALLVVIHASTVWLQVPAHGRLDGGHDAAVTRRLVRTNWVRTVGWTARGVVAMAMMVVAVPA